MNRGGPLRLRVAALVDALSVRYGECWATQRALREMLGQDGGRRPGANSVRRIMRALEREGVYVRKRVMPGGRLPDGQYSRKGTVRQVRLSRQVQRAIRRRRAKEERARVHAAAAASSQAAIRDAAAAQRASEAPAPAPPPVDVAAANRAREEAMAIVRAALAPARGEGPPK